MAVFKLTRRQLLLGAAGSAVVAGGAGLWLGVRKVNSWRFRKGVSREQAFSPNVFLSVADNGDVVVWLVKTEMGQGVSTALPMLVAEELDADWQRVRIEHATADGAYDYGSMRTASSASVRGMWDELRKAGATAREMLQAAGAERLGVSAAECSTQAGKVLHRASGKSASYGELASLAATLRAPLRPTLKDPKDFRIIGKPLTRLDLPAKITGRAEYGIDVRREGMLRAVVARAPAFGGSVKHVDDTAARKVAGVQQVVRIDQGVAVVATNSYAALRGREALEVSWELGEASDLDSHRIRQTLLETLDEPLGEGSEPDANSGDALAALSAGKVIEAQYMLPYLAHAAMEPMNALAEVSDERVSVWAPTQDPEGARRVAAEAAAVPISKVTVHKTYVGGGFGRRTNHDEIGEAVALSKKVGAPIQVLWSREDDFQHARYREASAHRLRSVLDGNGMPRAWFHKIATATPRAGHALGAKNLPYSIPNVRVEALHSDLPIPTTIWRSVDYSYNTFAVESFIDELAHQVKIDPLQYRIQLCSSKRLKHCLQLVKKLSGWTAHKGQGVACCECFGSYAAHVVQVVIEAGVPRVEKAFSVIDCGLVVNPDTVRSQLEGACIFGLSAALSGEVSVGRGGILESNFHDHPLLRMSEAPAIETHIVESSAAPGGVGEVGVPLAAPALANAIFAASGRRLRALPMRRLA